MLENIIFKMNLASRLAAADCPSGVAGNTDISEHTCTIIYHQQDPDNTDVLEVIFSKNGSLLFKNTSPYSRTQYFLANEPSQPFGRSRFYIWRRRKHRCSKHTCTIIYHQQDPDNMGVLEVTFPQNGSLFFINTSPSYRRQYFLSNEPSQPFGCSGMCVWETYTL